MLTRRGFFKGAGVCAAGVALVAVGGEAVAAVLAGDKTAARPVPIQNPRDRIFQWRLVGCYRKRDVVLREPWAVADMAGAEIFDASLWPRIYLFEPEGRGRVIRRFALFDPDYDRWVTVRGRNMMFHSKEICSVPVNLPIGRGDTLQMEVEELTVG